MVSESHLDEKAPAWRRRKDHRRPEILAAARELFAELGYEKTAVGEIARRAGVSEATVYKYFQSKPELVRQVFHDWMDPKIAIVEAGLPQVEGVRARLKLICVWHLHEMRRSPGLFRLVYRELRWDNYEGSALHQLNRRYANAVVWIVEEGVKAGEIDARTDPRLIRDLLFGGLEHVGWRLVFAERPAGAAADTDIEIAAAALADQIWRGLALRPEAEPAPGEARLQALAARLERAVSALEGAVS